jgi:anti-sigma regulatory factor (Ser/Thr protein kinase)
MTSPEPATGTNPPAQVVLDIDFDLSSLYPMRAAVAAHAGRLNLSDRIMENLLIVAGEQATNAIRHGGGSGRLRLWRDHDVLYCQVSDDGDGIADTTVGLHAPHHDVQGGRGLWLMRQLADDIDITSSVAGTVITATFHLTADPPQTP